MTDTDEAFVSIPPGLPPVSCDHQVTEVEGGKENVLCTLAAGECLVQRIGMGPDGREQIVCREPHCVFVDWQLVCYQMGD
jgi:hypothetical protein